EPGAGPGPDAQLRRARQGANRGAEAGQARLRGEQGLRPDRTGGGAARGVTHSGGPAGWSAVRVAAGRPGPAGAALVRSSFLKARSQLWRKRPTLPAARQAMSTATQTRAKPRRYVSTIRSSPNIDRSSFVSGSG